MRNYILLSLLMLLNIFLFASTLLKKEYTVESISLIEDNAIDALESKDELIDTELLDKTETHLVEVEEESVITHRDEKLKHLEKYNILRAQLTEKLSIYQKGDSSRASVKNYLFTTLSKKIFPSWYGTAWDFNGYTEKPLNGEIACGYFVTTTLKHIGFNLNRYKIAQQGPFSITEILCEKEYISVYTDNNFLQMIDDVLSIYL